MAVTTKLVVVFFTTPNGNPVTGLAPTIDIWNVTTSTQVVTAAAVTEVGGGIYKYTFTGYDHTQKFGFIVDGEAGGGPNLGAGQYAFGTNNSFFDDIAFGNWDETAADHTTAGTMGQLQNQISSGVTSIQADTTAILTDTGNILTDTGNILLDTGNILTATTSIQADTTAILADTTNIDTNVIDILTFVELILKFERNRTKIDKTAKTLTVYDDDKTTPIRVFSLKDSTGTPSITEITERDPQ